MTAFLHFIFCFFSFFATLLDDLDVIVQNGGNDRDHVGLDDASTDILCAPNTNINDALKRQVPFPHVHHIFGSAALENVDQTLNAAIDGKDVADAGG